jgi:membrane fusion protein
MPRDEDALPAMPRAMLAARNEQYISPIELPPPLPLKWAAGFGGAAMLALALFLTFGEYTRKIDVAGEITPAAGAIRVFATQAGRIATNMHGGDSVQRGQHLFELRDERAVNAQITDTITIRRKELEQQRGLTIRQLNEHAKTLANQLQLANEALANHRAALTIQADLVSSTRTTVASYGALAKEGYIARAALTREKNALSGERAKRIALDLNLTEAKQTIARLKQDIAANANQIQRTHSEARQQLATLDRDAAEHDGRSALRIAAPAAGSIAALAYKDGQFAPAGAQLAVIVPPGGIMEVALQVPSRALPHIKPGQQVWLRIDAFPYQRSGQQAGTVVLVDSSPVSDAAAGSEPLYKVVVALAKQSVTVDGAEQAVKAGMSLKAVIPYDRRRLIAWLFEPLIAAAKGRTP